MRLLFDCNVVLDILYRVDPFCASLAAYDVANLLHDDVFVPATVMPLIDYYAKKYNGASASQPTEVGKSNEISQPNEESQSNESKKISEAESDARPDMVDIALELFDIVDITSSDCVKAKHNNVKDYEDAIIVEAALRTNCDLIITRNLKDFVASDVKAISPDEYLKLFKPDNYRFELIDFDAK